MEKVKSILRRRRDLLLALTPLILLVLIVTSDLTVQYYHTPPGANCKDYVIYDVYGALKNTSISKNSCYFVGLSVNDFRALGKVKADKIIIVTHNFYHGRVTGLGTSDPVSPLAPILHPVSVFYLVKGETPDGKMYLAVSPGIAGLSLSLKGKTVILITCSENIDRIASGLIAMGARTVIVSNTPSLTPSQAENLVAKAISLDATSLCTSPLFHCYGG